MAVRLIKRDEPIVITIDGTKIELKQLTPPEKMWLDVQRGKLWKAKVDDSLEAYSDFYYGMAELVAPFVLSIEGCEQDGILDMLKYSNHTTLLTLIVDKLTSSATLTDAERKNSNSSSEQQAAIQASDAQAAPAN